MESDSDMPNTPGGRLIEAYDAIKNAVAAGVEDAQGCEFRSGTARAHAVAIEYLRERHGMEIDLVVLAAVDARLAMELALAVSGAGR